MFPKAWLSIFLGLFGAIFFFIGAVFLWFGVETNQEIEQLKQLPLLTAAQIVTARPGTEAAIEGRVAERNPLHAQGFVAYIRSLYKGERCTSSVNDDDDELDCSPIWTDGDQLTPPLWLDLPDGRTQLANDDYEIQTPPEIWLSTDMLVENETIRYQGFKINNPVFAKGIIISSANGSALNAEFIYGGNRQTYFSDWQGTATSFVWMGAIFAAFGLTALIAMACVLIFWR